MASSTNIVLSQEERAIKRNQHTEKSPGMFKAMNEKIKKNRQNKNNGLILSVRGPGAFLHRQLGMGSSG